MALSDVIKKTRNTLQGLGIQAFGTTMPILSPDWVKGTDPALPTLDEPRMGLKLESGEWVAPIGGSLRIVENADALRKTLVQPDGSSEKGKGLLLTVYPQSYLRLSRLYARVLEDETGARPERIQGIPFRPVPRYFFYSNDSLPNSVASHVLPQQKIGSLERLTIYDNDGMPIDPIAVASAFQAIMAKHILLQHRDLTEDPVPINDTQLKAIADLDDSDNVIHIRLSDSAGKPRDATNLEGITATAVPGIFTLNPSTGVGDRTVAVVPVSGGFPETERRLLKLGPSTSGELGFTFTPPPLPLGTSLQRDFFSLRVINLRDYLLGSPASGYIGSQAERRPPIRTDEPLAFLFDGNDVLGAITQTLAGNPTESLVIGQQIDGTFPAPAQPGETARWPTFPPVPAGTTPAPEGSLPLSLKEELEPNAAFFDDGDADTANIDVVLTLNNLPPGAAVRVYPRVFTEAALEERGDGAGVLVPNTGTVRVFLTDPFKLRKPGIEDSDLHIPTRPVLMADVLVVKRTEERRLYGAITAEVNETTTEAVPDPESNIFNNANLRGVSNAGVLGLGNRTEPLPSDSFDARIALTNDETPRNASHWPTMARREVLASGLNNNAWRSVLSAGRLSPELHSADARRGNPGSLGGRETQHVGVQTQNGRLAYDIARMAFRRAATVSARVEAITEDRWSVPDALAPGSANAGTFAGAVLQSIAPGVETPELHLIKNQIQVADIPSDFNEFVNWLRDRIDNAIPAGSNRRQRVISALLTTLQSQQNNATLSNAERNRLFDEIHRDVMASAFGRRDAQWALQRAIGSARQFLYIETPGFASTTKDYGDDPVPDYAVDLIKLIDDRLKDAPGLHVIICTPRFPDYAEGYEIPAALEARDRRKKILALHTVSSGEASRVIAFHPIGFPGRFSRIEGTTVIVDDVWAMMGSSTLRRRGLTFDGGSDLVFTDMRLRRGKCVGVQQLRQRLMALRLGVGIPEDNDEDLPETNFVRLFDGTESFYAIQEMLSADGIGRIGPLWNAELPKPLAIDAALLDAFPIDVANPEGNEFDFNGALIQNWFAGWQP